jgi:putative addiction module component (TIGR02574 family)
MDMTKKLKEATATAMALTRKERAQLAGKLLLSLDEPTEEEVEQLWIAESERRLEEFRSGSVKGIPADEVFRRAKADIA